MSKVFKRGPSKAEMDITPLIDVTFQLIIFFMLVNNIVAEESVEMIVPELTDPKTYELLDVDKITVNLVPTPYDRSTRVGDPLANPMDVVAIRVGITDFAPGDLEGVTNLLKSGRAENDEMEVVLRADAAFRYADVAPVMSAITGAGITKINLVAFLPDKGPSNEPPPPASN